MNTYSTVMVTEQELREALDRARETRNILLQEAEGAFSLNAVAAEYAYRAELVPCGVLHEKIESLRAEIRAIEDKAIAVRDETLAPARRDLRAARAEAASWYEEEKARLRKLHDRALRDLRSDVQRSNWQLVGVEGAGECLLSHLSGTHRRPNGPRKVEGDDALGLVSDTFVRSLGVEVKEDDAGVGWWMWSPAQATDVDAVPMNLAELLDVPDWVVPRQNDGPVLPSVPDEFREWVIQRTQDAVLAGGVHPYLVWELELVEGARE